ncbi:hypothetical protein [Cellulomonas sp. NPDC089187]|uniref:hypothetical protein n=1 Tax=Cellulomonas sp. NPDC089187 TaxID=3154970 RepID=UPI003439B659
MRRGREEFRVARIPLTGRLVERQSCDSDLVGGFGADAARRLAVGWALAARSRQTLVYFPIAPEVTRDGRLRNPLPEGRSDAPNVDLLLVPRGRLRPSRWPEIRSRLGPGTPTTIDLPEDAFQVTEEASERADRLSATRHARTLIVTGTGAAFADSLGPLTTLAEDLPAAAARHPEQFHVSELVLDRAVGQGLFLYLAPHGGVLAS